MAGLDIRALTLAEVETAIGWAAEEGWNPGLADGPCFLSVDPGGFFGGFLDGEMIASISVVNYDDRFAFLGFYIVAPEHRGQGHGLHLWRAALEHAGGRAVGLDGVPAQQANYARSDFAMAHRNIRFGGTVAPEAIAGGEGVRVTRVLAPTPEVLALDRAVFPAPREAFLRAWFRMPGHFALAAWRGDVLAGYGAIRPCREGFKIAPLVAADRAVAVALLDRLTRLGSGPARVFVDVPEPNGAALALMRDAGLEPVFETARMYRGAPPATDSSRLFGVTSFELG